MLTWKTNLVYRRYRVKKSSRKGLRVIKTFYFFVFQRSVFVWPSNIMYPDRFRTRLVTLVHIRISPRLCFIRVHIITSCSHAERMFSVVDFQEERATVLRNDTSGFMYRLNYPSTVYFPKLRYKQRLVTAIGHNIQLQFNHVVPAQSECFTFFSFFSRPFFFSDRLWSSKFIERHITVYASRRAVTNIVGVANIVFTILFLPLSSFMLIQSIQSIQYEIAEYFLLIFMIYRC